MAEDSGATERNVLTEAALDSTPRPAAPRYSALAVSANSDIRVLLIEDSAADARLMQVFLSGTPLYRFRLTHVERLGEALQRLKTSTYDVILLDLTLPDSDGLGSLERLLDETLRVPVVVLTNTNNPDLALEAVRQGAQDYLIKRHMNHEVLVRSLKYAIERKQQAEALRVANEALEERVQARTYELETANQQLRQEVLHRQNVQERLVLAQKVGKIGIFEWNIRSGEMAWSDELELLYGVSEEAFGGHYTDWINTLHEDDRASVKQALWQVVGLGEGLTTEFRILHPSGERWMAVKSRLFNGDDDKPLRMLGVHMDITEKKQLEAQFLQAQRLESLGTLASGVAHDLNNILTPILGVGQLLPITLTNIDEQSAQLIEMLNCSAQRGTKLVQQILAFARDTSDLRRIISVGEVLDEIERIIGQALPRSIAFEKGVDSALWLVKGDDTQLHQVFMNLCVNARDAMPEGGQLRVHAENLLIDESYVQMYPEASLGAHVVVTVSDSGTGIPAQTLAHIFDPFFTTKDPGQGTGLGLAAVLGIVKSHGGFIDVQTVIDQGSQFRVFLPADPGSVKSPTVPLEVLQGQQELVLVVDDEPAVCQVMQLSLETYGYEVLVAPDGVGAIALLAEHRDRISCVVIDLMMPDMDGRTAIPLLKRLNPQVPIVVMTGAMGNVSEAQIDPLSIQGTLAKPFTTRALLTLLQQALHPQA
ncbi:MAG: response regulator [Cyanobacteria bacterium P01_F01_bin.53]